MNVLYCMVTMSVHGNILSLCPGTCTKLSVSNFCEVSFIFNASVCGCVNIHVKASVLIFIT